MDFVSRGARLRGEPARLFQCASTLFRPINPRLNARAQRLARSRRTRDSRGVHRRIYRAENPARNLTRFSSLLPRASRHFDKFHSATLLERLPVVRLTTSSVSSRWMPLATLLRRRIATMHLSSWLSGGGFVADPIKNLTSLRAPLLHLEFCQVRLFRETVTAT